MIYLDYLWPLEMLTRYLNHKQQTQGDRMCAEIADKLFIIWVEVFGEALKWEFVI